MSESHEDAIYKVAALIVAAGRGRRMGAGKNKVFLPLLGKPILLWTLQGFLQHPGIGKVVLVVSSEDKSYVQGLIDAVGWSKPISLVDGGAERIDSVYNGLQVLEEEWSWVAVHDGARPLFTPELISKSIQMALDKGSAVAAVPVKDTIKEATADGFVIGTPERDKLWAVQTPQIFPVKSIKKAYENFYKVLGEQRDFIPTDDAMIMEKAGHAVSLVYGENENIKITTPEDLLFAEAILKKRLGGEIPASENCKHWRSGIGYDVHKLVAGRPLILGGVEIPYEMGLLGHSDADVLLHAVKDALLGAAGMGDIGRHFPDCDSRYKGISSMKLLAEVKMKLAERGFVPGNVDAIVVAQKPKLASYIPKMNENLAKVLEIPIENVNVKATTTEGLGFTGTGEGIAAYAIVAVR